MKYILIPKWEDFNITYDILQVCVCHCELTWLGPTVHSSSSHDRHYLLASNKYNTVSIFRFGVSTRRFLSIPLLGYRCKEDGRIEEVAYARLTQWQCSSG
jgi:hypothetical protein